MNTENSLQGTAERRNQLKNNNNSNVEEFKCPLCKFSTVDAVKLQDHFSTSHPDPAANPARAHPGAGYQGQPNSVCIYKHTYMFIHTHIYLYRYIYKYIHLYVYSYI
jgi:hypothetical protein